MKPKIKLMHDKGKAPCMGIAFYYAGNLRPGDQVLSSHTILINGDRPSTKASIVCGTCQKEMGWTSISIDKEGEVHRPKVCKSRSPSASN